MDRHEEEGEITRINTTLDKDSLFTKKAEHVISLLEDTMRKIHSEGLTYSNWYGRLKWSENTEQWANRGIDYKPYPNAYDDDRIPWFKYWEVAQMFIGSGILEEDDKQCLDMGGASSVFSFLLANLGHSVVSIDLRKPLVVNGDVVARHMGWNLRSMPLNLLDIQVFGDESFDYIFSICVMEHLKRRDRIEAMRKVTEALKPDGVLGLTFDYLNPHPRVRIDSLRDVRNQFIIPSGLRVLGPRFEDNGKRYLEHMDKRYTFGSILLKKD